MSGPPLSQAQDNTPGHTSLAMESSFPWYISFKHSFKHFEHRWLHGRQVLICLQVWESQTAGKVAWFIDFLTTMQTQQVNIH